MKKVFALSLILALAVSSASFGAAKKTVIQTPNIKVAAPAETTPAPAASSGISVGPKLIMNAGTYNGIAVGVESYFFSPMPGVQLGAEGSYQLQTNNVSWLYVGGIGRYMIPMEGQMFMPYVGGGLGYNMFSINVPFASSSSAGGIGFKVFGGADFPVPGIGTFYGNVGYQISSFTLSVTAFGQTFSSTANTGGLYIEGGDRFTF